MDLPSMGQLAPQILVAIVIIVAVGWFRKQDQKNIATLRKEVQRSIGPPPDDYAGESGRYTAVADPWERLGEQFDDLGKKVDEEIVESRKFREATGQRVTALETDVRWLKRETKSRGHEDTHDDRRK